MSILLGYLVGFSVHWWPINARSIFKYVNVLFCWIGIISNQSPQHIPFTCVVDVSFMSQVNKNGRVFLHSRETLLKVENF